MCKWICLNPEVRLFPHEKTLAHAASRWGNNHPQEHPFSSERLRRSPYSGGVCKNTTLRMIAMRNYESRRLFPPRFAGSVAISRRESMGTVRIHGGQHPGIGAATFPFLLGHRKGLGEDTGRGPAGHRKGRSRTPQGFSVLLGGRASQNRRRLRLYAHQVARFGARQRCARGDRP